MLKPLLLRVHRWTTLIFALPLFFVLVTGVILSVEPAMTRGAIVPGSLSAAQLEQLINKHDPGRTARGLTISPLDNTLTLVAGKRSSSANTVIDLATGERAVPGWRWADVFMTSRHLHERLLLDATWLVIASTVAMLVLVGLGAWMGLPRLRQTVSGWHQGMGWFGLPLLILSPLTGLFLAFGITFAGAPTATPGPTPSLVEAVRLIGAEHDLAALSRIRPRAGMTASIHEDGMSKVYAVTRAGVTALPANWPRLIHEGTFGGALGSILNLVVSLASVGLLGTGLVIWARRRFRKPQRTRGPVITTGV